MSLYFRLDETTFTQLYNATITAFPNTKYRHNVVDTIKVKNVKFVPYQGLNTLFIKSLAENTEKNTEYKTMVLIKNINYKNQKNAIKIYDEYGKSYNLERPKISINDVLVRCGCKDFHWRFNYYNSLDKSLYGNKRQEYASKGTFEANPSKSPGVCKHLMKLFEQLIKKKIIGGA